MSRYISRIYTFVPLILIYILLHTFWLNWRPKFSPYSNYTTSRFSNDTVTFIVPVIMLDISSSISKAEKYAEAATDALRLTLANTPIPKPLQYQYLPIPAAYVIFYAKRSQRVYIPYNKIKDLYRKEKADEIKDEIMNQIYRYRNKLESSKGGQLFAEGIDTLREVLNEIKEEVYKISRETSAPVTSEIRLVIIFITDGEITPDSKTKAANNYCKNSNNRANYTMCQIYLVNRLFDFFRQVRDDMRRATPGGYETIKPYFVLALFEPYIEDTIGRRGGSLANLIGNNRRFFFDIYTQNLTNYLKYLDSLEYADSLKYLNYTRYLDSLKKLDSLKQIDTLKNSRYITYLSYIDSLKNLDSLWRKEISYDHTLHVLITFNKTNISKNILDFMHYYDKIGAPILILNNSIGREKIKATIALSPIAFIYGGFMGVDNEGGCFQNRDQCLELVNLHDIDYTLCKNEYSNYFCFNMKVYKQTLRHHFIKITYSYSYNRMPSSQAELASSNNENILKIYDYSLRYLGYLPPLKSFDILDKNKGTSDKENKYTSKNISSSFNAVKNKDTLFSFDTLIRLKDIIYDHEGKSSILYFNPTSFANISWGNDLKRNPSLSKFTFTLASNVLFWSSVSYNVSIIVIFMLILWLMFIRRVGIYRDQGDRANYLIIVNLASIFALILLVMFKFEFTNVIIGNIINNIKETIKSINFGDINFYLNYIKGFAFIFWPSVINFIITIILTILIFFEGNNRLIDIEGMFVILLFMILNALLVCELGYLDNYIEVSIAMLAFLLFFGVFIITEDDLKNGNGGDNVNVRNKANIGNIPWIIRVVRIVVSFLPLLFTWGYVSIYIPFVIFALFSAIELIIRDFMENNLETLSTAFTFIGVLVLIMPPELLLSISSIFSF